MNFEISLFQNFGSI